MNNSLTFPGIILIGLGPGDPDLLTRQAWRILENSSEIYLRTRQHPVVDRLPAHIVIHSFDYLYEGNDRFESVYAQIVDKVLELGRRPGGVVYAVPGHPYVAEATAPEIARCARQSGLPVQVIEGLSFLEPTLTALGQDPFPQITLVDALELAVAHVPLFPPSAPALIAQIYSRSVASDVKLTLMTWYPDEHPVQLVHAAGLPQQLVETLPLYAIDRSSEIGLLTCLYVPPLGKETGFEEFLEIIARLRAPDGCPWDRKQTHQTLRNNLLEESYEVLAALDADDPQAMQEELGDLLLMIALQTQIAVDNGEFNMTDVLRGIHTKIVRRHPHVFGEFEAENAQAVVQNWAKLKAEERVVNGKAEAGMLDSVPLALPALTQADQYQARAAQVGFDWPNVEGVKEKVIEEWTEVQSAPDEKARADEIGDLLFAVVNLARWYKVDAESVLRTANQRFRHRFSYIERAAQSQGRLVADLTLQEMDTLWNEAKRQR